MACKLQAVVLVGFTPEEFTAFRSMMIAMEVRRPPSNLLSFAAAHAAHAGVLRFKDAALLMLLTVALKVQGDMVKLISCTNAMLRGTLRSAVEASATTHEQAHT